MVALAYEDLGGISSVADNPKVPASIRSRDRNDKQRFAFQCDPARPFTGIIHVQAAVGNPSKSTTDTIWFDIAEMIIDEEGGSWSYEAIGEFSSVRVVCKAGNYWSAAHGSSAATVAANGNFTINGINIAVTAGDDAATVAGIINANAGIILDGTIKADVISPTSLRIYKTDGADLLLVDTTNTPLADLGISAGTFRGGVITKIQMLR